MDFKDRSSNFRMLNTIAQISLWFMITAITLLILLHFINPQISVTWQFISEYALGNGGFLMNMVFFAYAISLISFSIILWKQTPNALGKIGLIMALISSIGMILGGVFNTDPQGTTLNELSTSGILHNVGGQLNLTPFVALLITISLRNKSEWKPISLTLIITTMIILIFTVLFVSTAALSQGELGPGTYTGLMGRFMFVSYSVWQIITTRLYIKMET